MYVPTTNTQTKGGSTVGGGSSGGGSGSGGSGNNQTANNGTSSTASSFSDFLASLSPFGQYGSFEDYAKSLQSKDNKQTSDWWNSYLLQPGEQFLKGMDDAANDRINGWGTFFKDAWKSLTCQSDKYPNFIFFLMDAANQAINSLIFLPQTAWDLLRGLFSFDPYTVGYSLGTTFFMIFEIILAKAIAEGLTALAEKLGELERKIGGAGSKIIESSDKVTFRQSSIDKAFGKHSADFGVYPDGSKASVELFKNDIKNLINTGTQKSGTYRATAGTHIYNPSTKQWVFINFDGSFNTAFKLSVDQFKYLIETGVVK